MVGEARDLVHRLVQRAAEGDVGFLEAAADREQRHAARERLGDDRQDPGVARRVERQRFIEHVLVVVARMTFEGEPVSSSPLAASSSASSSGGSTLGTISGWHPARRTASTYFDAAT